MKEETEARRNEVHLCPSHPSCLRRNQERYLLSLCTAHHRTPMAALPCLLLVQDAGHWCHCRERSVGIRRMASQWTFPLRASTELPSGGRLRLRGPGNAGAQGTPLTTAARPAGREGSHAQNNSPESACSSLGGKPKRHFSPSVMGLRRQPLMGPKWNPIEVLSAETIRSDRC